MIIRRRKRPEGIQLRFVTIPRMTFILEDRVVGLWIPRPRGPGANDVSEEENDLDGAVR